MAHGKGFEELFLVDKDIEGGSRLSSLSASLLPAAMLNPFVTAFLSSYMMIIVSEIGDKTFFIAAILAMKRGAKVTFLGAASALVVMTVISACAGRVLPALVDPVFTHYACVVLFLCFGVKLIWEGYNMKSGPSGEEPEEYKEVEMELANRRVDNASDSVERGESSAVSSVREITTQSDKSITPVARRAKALFRKAFVSAAFTEAFTMTFAAEWGDRSQVATLAMGASKNIWGVNLGGCLGHLTCTTLAVVGGRLLVTRISEKSVSLVGGATFLLFAIAGIFVEL